MKFQNFKISKYIFCFLFLALHSLTNTYGMMKALNTAATGMAAQETNVNTISNNIANVNTIGFKRARTEFEDLLYETVQHSGARSSATTRYNVGIQIGSGAKVSAIRREFGQGSAQITNNPFDIMINGEGLFGIVLPNNELQFTRDGSFNVDSQSRIVTKQGYQLFPGFTVPPNTVSVNISENGTVDCYLRGQLEPTNIGTIPVFTFINQVGLKSSGANLYKITESSGNPIQNIAGENNAGRIKQGALEASNVNVMSEMTNLIKAQRAYEMNSKVINTADQMLQTVNNIRN